MKISEIMTTKVQCMRPENTLEEAAGVMRKLDIGAVPVCGDHDKLIGMLTDRDITIRAVAEGRPPSTSVQEVLSPGVIYAFETQDVDDAVHVMEKYQIRRMPVINAEKRLVGIISLGDVATHASSHLGGEALHDVSTPSESQSEDPANH
jgi:CBS domain-containing protein